MEHDQNRGPDNAAPEVGRFESLAFVFVRLASLPFLLLGLLIWAATFAIASVAWLIGMALVAIHPHPHRRYKGWAISPADVRKP